MQKPSKVVEGIAKFEVRKLIIPLKIVLSEHYGDKSASKRPKFCKLARNFDKKSLQECPRAPKSDPPRLFMAKVKDSLPFGAPQEPQKTKI